MRLQGMDQNNFFLDAINHKAIKVRPTPTFKTAFLVMALCQKLSRPSFKSYVNNIWLCQACFLKLKFPWLKIFKFFVCSIIKAVRPFYLITEWHVVLYLENNTCPCTDIQTVQVQQNASSYSLSTLG